MECPCFFYLDIHSPSLFSRCTLVVQATEVNVITYHIHMRYMQFLLTAWLGTQDYRHARRFFSAVELNLCS